MNEQHILAQGFQETQAVAASATEKCPTDLGSNDQATVPACGADKKTVKSMKSPDYKLNYSDEKKKELSLVKDIVLEEIKRVSSDSLYGATTFAGGSNAVVEVSQAHQNGVYLAAADVNREHGSDEAKTGASIMLYGMQHPILIITYKMAMAAGIKVKHFKFDPDQTHEWNDNDLVLLDGHGRIDFLLSIEKDKWPQVYGVFPSPDKEGFYDLTKLMAEINVNVSKWATQDLVQKRRLEEGVKAHEGWGMIDELVKKGYKYQAACQAVTLETDRIKVSDVNGGDAKVIFANYTSAIKVHEALVTKFGENVLKTKEFSREVSSLWKDLVGKGGNDFAVTHMLSFIEAISPATVSAINNAKKSDKGVSKDEQRKQLLKDAFDLYCSKI